MSNRNIPAPSNAQINTAQSGVSIRAKVHNIDTADLKNKAFMESQINVIASLEAEIAWLRKIVHYR